MRETRLDYGRLRKAKRTPQGGIKVPAWVTRTGVFSYARTDGTVIKELRHPDDVFNADSLASMADAPVTNGHPESLVDAQTWKEYAVGYVREQARRQDNRVVAELTIQDKSTIDGIESGDLVEVSCGYTCDSVSESGNYEGESYDRRQTNIQYNHTALGPKGWGRAGRDVALRLDSGGQCIAVATYAPKASKTAATKAQRGSPAAKQTNKGYTMTLPSIEVGDCSARIDGVDYSLQTDEGRSQAKQALSTSASRTKQIKFDSEDAGAAAAMQSAVAACIAAQEQLLSLASVQAATPALEPEKVSAEALDALVAERTALLAHAKEIAPEVKMDGLSDRELMTAALLHRSPETKLDGKSEDFVRGLFEATQPVRNDSVDKARAAAVAPKEERVDARAEFLKKSSEAWRQPLSASSENLTVNRGY